MSKAFVVAGLGFGDEGKGTICDFLTRKHKAHTVVRYNGGAQCGHNVVEGARHHTFAQFGSGTLAGASTFLSQYTIVNPLSLLNEAKGLQAIGESNPLDRMYIDGHAIITTPYQVAANRLREEHRGAGIHGSCGMGVGETVADFQRSSWVIVGTVKAGHMTWRMKDLRQLKIEELEREGITRTDSPHWEALTNDDLLKETVERYEYFAKNVHVVGPEYLHRVMKDGTTVFEGAQGVLLDQDYGFHPYTTWTNIRFDNALELLKGFNGDVTRMGVTRSYSTRHGPGPFPTHGPELQLGEKHNGFNPWQRDFRTGALDYVLLDYSLRVLGGVDEVVMTHLDIEKTPMCVGYDNVDWDVFEPGDFYGARIPVRPVLPVEADQLAWQTKLSAALERVTPITGSLFCTTQDEYFKHVFNIPVTIKSYGPDHKDKRDV